MSYIRLAIFGGVLLIIAALTATVYKFRGDAIAAEASERIAKDNLLEAEAANKANDATITRLTDWRNIENKLLLDLRTTVEKSNAAIEKQSATIAKLREENAAVDAFLRTSIPPDLERLLNGDGTEDGNNP